MRRLREVEFVRWFLLPFTLVLWLGFTSCTHWSASKTPVEQVLENDHPGKIRLTTVDEQVIELQSPRIDSDTLYGFGFVGEKKGAAQPLKFPVAEVRSVEVRTTNAAGTVLLVAGVGLLLAMVIAAATWDGPFGDTSGGGGGSSYGSEPISCPLVYSWDGEAWRLDSGTFGGAFLEPLARTDVDNLVFVRASDGVVKLRLANELFETDYVDAIRLLAVDHPLGTEVVPDAMPNGALHVVGSLEPPLTARDDRGRDALAAVSAVDDWAWESSPSGRDTAVAADLRDGLVLEFARPAGAREATLVIDGNNTPWAAMLMQEYVAAHGRETDAWYAEMNGDPLAARTLGLRMAREGFLQVSVWTERGWEPRGLVWEAGPEVSKRQAMRLDLTGVETGRLRVRLESIPLFWRLDRVAVDYSSAAGGSAPSPQGLTATSARMEADGRDVSVPLSSIDGDRLALRTGDAARLEFDVPPVPEGMARSYLVESSGWYRAHTRPSTEAPDPAIVQFEREGTFGTLSRLAVARLNEALALMAERSLDRASMGREEAR